MNYCILMGQLVSKQKYIKICGKHYIYVKLTIPNNKKVLNYYKVLALAHGEKAKDLIELYRIRDSIVIEAAISIRKYKDSSNNKTKKFILFQIYDIHPTHNILNNFV
uniref:Putative single-stranded DNA binding protein n=1 Tax=Gelidium elegans TaxID=37200 RepID=A0A141SDE7_GELEL|nr:putative single-stranded DNA binding protein [Gelidium elegans]AMK96315.1 putative single-stranded DNA binding protein [Gelidium elegans]